MFSCLTVITPLGQPLGAETTTLVGPSVHMLISSLEEGTLKRLKQITNGHLVSNLNLHACRSRDDRAGLDCLSYG